MNVVPASVIMFGVCTSTKLVPLTTGFIAQTPFLAVFFL
uniref:Uncharacterized protein n=1 Tax=Coprothermobacter proteolyticus (strain ATCC 35245 / DSM 5265 / OCM 4 / BT) TaxID=309798 RepID=B5Y747_COPPD